jgi:hypothetical protein
VSDILLARPAKVLPEFVLRDLGKRGAKLVAGSDKCKPSIFSLPQFGYENPLKAKDFLALAPEACIGFGSGQK